LQTLEAEHVISSAPMRPLVCGLSPQVSERTRRSAESLKYRDFITVMLILKERNMFDDNWIYIHDPSVKVGRIQNFRSWSPEMVPDPDKACYGLEYFCFEHDGLWDSNDEDLIDLGKRELIKIGLEKKAMFSTAASSARRRPIQFTMTITRTMSPRFAKNSRNVIRTSTSLGATACTSTTTRTTP
jgi:protoporphyrinogen oxidase